MANCRQACPYNTLDGCKVKEYKAICPFTNTETPITEYRMTNADRIRMMSDEELSVFLWEFDREEIARATEYSLERRKITEWIKQPAE